MKRVLTLTAQHKSEEVSKWRKKSHQSLNNCALNQHFLAHKKSPFLLNFAPNFCRSQHKQHGDTYCSITGNIRAGKDRIVQRKAKAEEGSVCAIIV